MSAPIEEVNTISRAVALEHGPGVTVDGVTFDGGSDRVEVLVSIADCHSGPCRVSVNVTRSAGADFERDFRAKLSEALEKHKND